MPEEWWRYLYRLRRKSRSKKFLKRPLAAKPVVGGAPGRALRAGSKRCTIPESFVDLTRPVRTLFDLEEIAKWPYRKNARSRLSLIHI